MEDPHLPGAQINAKSQFSMDCEPKSSHFLFFRKEKMYCVKHKKYKPGCEDCQEKIESIKKKKRKDKKLSIENKTHYKNGIPKPQGIYSDENWKKFNELGRKLTN